jgi:thiol peroxidase
MAQVLFKGNPVNTAGQLPAVGSQAPSFRLTKTDLSDVSIEDFKGKKVVLNIFHSIDTGTCAASVRRFNQEAAGLDNTVVLCISKDLPFAHNRFCEAEGIDNVVPVSQYKDSSFADAYGVQYTDSVIEGLLGRAIVVVDENGTIIHTEQVEETSEEPDYDKVLAVLKG